VEIGAFIMASGGIGYIHSPARNKKTTTALHVGYIEEIY